MCLKNIFEVLNIGRFALIFTSSPNTVNESGYNIPTAAHEKYVGNKQKSKNIYVLYFVYTEKPICSSKTEAKFSKLLKFMSGLSSYHDTVIMLSW
jgi:hypothetical protein